MDKQATERNPFWDSLKYLLIFIVVYGHMIETCVEDSPFNQAMYNYIYLFHMPLFVFISGHFSHIKNKRKYLMGMVYIFETYFVFQFIRCLKPLLFYTHLSLFPDILIPKGILWYLACLLLWRIVIYTMMDGLLECRKWSVLFFFIITGLSIGFIQVSNGTLIRFFTLGFFFFLGYYVKDSMMESLFQRVPSIVAISLIISLWLIVYLYLNIDIQSVIYFGSYYDNLPIPVLNYLGARIFLYVFAVVVGFLLMRVVHAKSLFPYYGNYTLSIFMYHTFIIQALRPLFENDSIPLYELLLFIISIIICFSIVWLTQHFKFMTIMLNPITYFLNRYTYYKK